MPLRPVPWAIGNGAENSVELARAGLFVGSNGATGIVGIKDFKVSALPTPGAAVRVAKGTGVISSTYPGTFGQSYAVQEQSFTDVPVAATGSSGATVKYVYVLVEDTQYGGQTPPSVKNGPYNDYAVTTTLPSNQPYLLLARINQPASTATITNAMITDTREMANPRVKIVNRARPSVASDTGMKLSSTTGEWFPGDGAETGARQEIDVPSWATRMIIEPAWYSVRYEANTNVWGFYWISYGPTGGGGADGEPFLYKTQGFRFDAAGAKANAMRTNWLMSDDRYVPAAMRGKSGSFAFRARRDSSASNNAAVMDKWSGLSLKVTFLEEPDRSTE